MLMTTMDGEVPSFVLCCSMHKILAYDEVGIRLASVSTWQARKESAEIPTMRLGTTICLLSPAVCPIHPLLLPFGGVRPSLNAESSARSYTIQSLGAGIVPSASPT